MIVRTASAKINLALHVTGQTAEGYHELDTLVVFTHFGDRIMIERSGENSPSISLRIEGPFSHALSASSGNLVTTAASALREAYITAGGQPKPVLITLEKNLPVSSGIGGGSADAAATLSGLHEFWQFETDLAPLALELGADVPMCLHSTPLQARGIGEVINPLSLHEEIHLVLVNPGIEIATPKVFGALETKNNSGIETANGNNFPSIQSLKALRNDLETPAIKLAPEIGTLLNDIQQTHPIICRMSGSGSTCFGVYETAAKAEEARAYIQKTRPHDWCVATRAKNVIKNCL